MGKSESVSALISAGSALISALGGAKGIILLVTTLAASYGSCTYQLATKNDEIKKTQQQVTAVAEAYSKGTPYECPPCPAINCRNRVYK